MDDGDHTLDGQYETFQNYFPLLKEGGLYIIEDAEYTAEHLVEKIGEGEVIYCQKPKTFHGRWNNKMVLIKNYI